MSGGGSPDFFYREALRLGYVARSAFKLLQMQKQYRLITPGDSVLDLGCAPGAWLQVACQSLGPAEKGGVVVGIDVKSEDCLRRRNDSLEGASQSTVPTGPWIFRDIVGHVPPVSGISSKDAALSCELGARALSLAIGSAELPSFDGSVEGESYLGGCSGGVLRAGGNLVIKLLESEDNREFAQFCKPLFKRMSWTRPKATRSSSREIYLVCQGLE